MPIQNWPDATPRVPKDGDLVLGLDLIKDADQQKSVVTALNQNGFKASDGHMNSDGSSSNVFNKINRLL